MAKVFPFRLRYTAWDRVLGRPRFEDLGFIKDEMFYQQNAFVANPNPPPFHLKIIQNGFPNFLLNRYGANFTGLIIGDYEHIGVRLGMSDAVLTEDRDALNSAIDIFRQTLPQAKHAVYGAGGIQNLHHNVANDTVLLEQRRLFYLQWGAPSYAKLDEITTNAYTTLAPHVHQLWADMVTANVNTIRQVAPGKPIIVFVKPRYVHNPNLNNDWITYAQWLAQLQHLAMILTPADTMNIWEGRVGTWDPRDAANWYQATTDWVASLPEQAPAPPPPPPPLPMISAVITADTWIDQGTPTTNYGSHGEIKAMGGTSNQRMAFLRAAVTGVPTQGLQSAGLHIVVYNETTGMLHLRPFSPSSAWDENEVTWNNPPVGVVGSVISMTATPPAPSNVTFTGLESVITADGTYEFRIDNTSATDGCAMASSDPSNGPDAPLFTLVANPQPIPNAPPVISSADKIDAVIGEEYVYQIVATDPEATPLTFMLVANPPAGMTISSLGEIRWTPATIGSINVSYEVSDGVNVVSRSYTIEVTDSCSNNLSALIIQFNQLDARVQSLQATIDSIKALVC